MVNKKDKVYTKNSVITKSSGNNQNDLNRKDGELEISRHYGNNKQKTFKEIIFNNSKCINFNTYGKMGKNIEH